MQKQYEAISVLRQRQAWKKKTIDHQFLAFLPFLLFAAVQYPKIQEEGKQKL